MKKNSLGFTLIELLAVIAVLAIILIIATTSVSSIKKKANYDEARKIEQSLTDLGPGIYSYEMMNEEGTFKNLYSKKDEFILSFDELKEAGYLENLSSNGKITNPFGGNDCDAYILVDPENNSFKGYLDCGVNYKTEEYDTYKGKTQATLTPDETE